MAAVMMLERRTDAAVVRAAGGRDPHVRRHLAGDGCQALRQSRLWDTRTRPTTLRSSRRIDRRVTPFSTCAARQPPAVVVPASAPSRYAVLVAPGSGCPIDRSPR